MFNSQMNWNTHINYIASKISRTVGILYRLKDIYPQSVLLTLYNTLILPHFHYCLLLWGSSIKENHPLHLLQKKAVRIIDNGHYSSHRANMQGTQVAETSGHVFNCTMEILP